VAPLATVKALNGEKALAAPACRVEVLYRFDVTYLKAGEHSLVIPIPDRIADLIGRIVVLFPLSLRSKPPSLYGDGGANSVA
jgi:hypothetical protein